MARKLGRLKAAQIDRLPPGRHHDGGGLYLVVGKTTGRSWIFRFRKDHKLHDYGLGPAHTVGLALARKKATECRLQLYNGGDPVASRKTARLEKVMAAAKALTFETAADQYIDSHAAGWRDGRSEAQWRQSLRDHVFPHVGTLPVNGIDTGLVLKVLQPIWTTKPETASRVRGRIESILAWATTRGYRFGENPARWRGHLDNLLPSPAKVRSIEHHPALPYAEIGSFMADLRQQSSIAARALEFLVLTASRSGEVLGARWDEINFTDRVWIIPGTRMKTAKEHRVPLSDAAMAIVEQMAELRTNDFVFPGMRGGPLGQMSLRQVMAAVGHNGYSVHGFRSSFRDWAAERTTTSFEVAEAALAHQVGNAVQRAYQRGDLFEKRRRLMEAWESYCAIPAAGSVVPLRA
jgi:integrase